MLVQCPNCKTTYKVSEEVLKGSTPAFRCSRCRHTFELETEEPAPVPEQLADEGAAKNRPPVQNQELSFSFPAKTPASPLLDDAPVVTEAPNIEASNEAIAVEEQWSLTSQAASEPAPAQGDAPFTLAESTPPAPAKSFGAPKEFAAEYPTIGADTDEASSAQNILPMSSYMDQQASILPYLTLFALLVMGFSLAAMITHAHPKASEELVKKIPLLGTAVLKNSHLKNGILLQSLRGGYQNIQGNREIFVITGVAVNQNPVVIREIQLTGKIYNGGGQETEEQTVWVGNTLSARILRGMTLEDIPHLQSLKPLKSFEMPPGDSVPFAMVFLKAVKGVKVFSCAVAFADSAV
ncbi:MAG: zinc-ribbon domain-containing protein [Candidatus Binatia bacterium]